MRDNAVTYSKALAILMMVLGHACYSTYVPDWVNMFDIPVFYFMSGYCFNERYLLDFKSFALKKLQGIYLPYIKWILIFILLHNFLYDIGVYNSLYGYKGDASSMYLFSDILNEVKNTLFKLSGSERLLGGYWFLPCLLVGLFIFYSVVKLSYILKKQQFILIGGGLLLVVSMLCNFFHISFWVLNYKVFESAFFILFGYEYKRRAYDIHNSVWFVIISFILVTIGASYWKGAAVNVPFNHQLQFIITAICGCVALFGVCKRIDEGKNSIYKKCLKFIGDNTLTILTWHFSLFVIVSYCITIVYGLTYLRIGEFPVVVEYNKYGWWIAYFLFGTSGSLFIAYCNKFIKSKWLKL